MKIVKLAVLAAFLPITAQAASVDLSGWISEEANGERGSNWNVQGAGNDSVFQTQNSRPSVFFDSGALDRGTSLEGEIRVETTSDDDFIGFVLGYDTGEFDGSTSDFWLIDWKQADQSFPGLGTSFAGMSLSHVTGNVGAADELDFWQHTGVVNEVQRATTLGSTGWNDNQSYNFKLTFTANLIEVFVDDQKELSFAGSFGDGAFGFYNYSQSQVRYAGITEDQLPAPVPLPAAGFLLAGALGGMGLMRRRKKA
ncbi:VPLPA-CTERM sorting domain-containing protein [Epibacterium sp. SM1969]|uniref:VPLPA-CTERM sorting domain-containing protein n=1 Tax=Tritonibacter aquimaris TaxID=2663379 RepID=A0A844AY43_9RHOB|nr:VPLPA-CTERM sorting domain-containing protein [Tritonibacter aquimaris]MQY42871.1 VPLPA-CTERM sorting domain-containing protein [Tritonibacter aquimaris]